MRTVCLGNLIILMLLVIYSHPVENRPNRRHGLYKVVIRQRKKDTIGTTKWPRKYPGIFPLSFQKQIISELFSKGNVQQSNVPMTDKEHSKLVNYVDSSSTGKYEPGNSRRKKRKLEPSEDIVLRDISVPPQKSIGLDQLFSLTQSKGFHYKHVASFPNIHLKDPSIDLPSNGSCPECDDNGVIRLAFNISTPHSTTFRGIDQVKLIFYVSYHSDNTEAALRQEASSPVFCNIVIVQHVSDPNIPNHKRPTVVDHKIIQHNVWHSIDVTEMVLQRGHEHHQNSSLFSIDISFNCTTANLEDAPSPTHGVDNAVTSTSFFLEKDPMLVFFSKQENARINQTTPLKSHDQLSFESVFLNLNSTSPTPIGNEKEQTASQYYYWNQFDESPRSESERLSLSNEGTNSTSFLEPKSRQKRGARRVRGGRNSCRRKELYISFSEIRYTDVIIFPQGYQAYQCVGRCYSPISNHLTPTAHAVIQNLIHRRHPRKASRACCVPTKLNPISIIYYNESMLIDSRNLQDMVVAECGCR